MEKRIRVSYFTAQEMGKFNQAVVFCDRSHGMISDILCLHTAYIHYKRQLVEDMT